jgi:hypothetical protein
MRITIFHRLHHQPGQRLAHIPLSLAFPGKLLDTSRVLGCQRHKRLFTTQRPKLGPQEFTLGETQHPQALSARAPYRQSDVAARHLNDLYQIK